MWILKSKEFIILFVNDYCCPKRNRSMVKHFRSDEFSRVLISDRSSTESEKIRSTRTLTHLSRGGVRE